MWCWLRKVRLVAKPEKPIDPSVELLQDILRVLVSIRRNIKATEANNQLRHEELLKALKPTRPGVGLSFEFGVPVAKERK